MDRQLRSVDRQVNEGGQAAEIPDRRQRRQVAARCEACRGKSIASWSARSGGPLACPEAGDIRSRAITWGKIADILFQRGQLDEALTRLLRMAYREAEALRIPEMEQIAEIRKDAGLPE